MDAQCAHQMEWTPSGHIRTVSPKNAYNNVLAALETIANTARLSQQLKTYPNACHKHASYPKFARDFESTLTAPRIQLDDLDVRMSVNNLNKQSIKNAISITGRSLDEVHDAVLHNFDRARERSNDQLSPLDRLSSELEEIRIRSPLQGYNEHRGENNGSEEEDD
ncbi:hypothetical protein CLU79DRAFT_832568 [Phycomyces nitens]|nr:hypothetical protein CLU79DRAFT_832568 [Phycomyces nitens]